MQKTYMQKTAEIERQWHLVDVQGKILGRVATEIAELLIGKHKPTYTPHIDGGDYVVVINASGVELSRDKANKKVYRRQASQRPGGLKEVGFKEMQEKHPERIIELAVKNMLPKNRLRDNRMGRLKVYAGSEHAHQSQLDHKAEKAGK